MCEKGKMLGQTTYPGTLPESHGFLDDVDAHGTLLRVGDSVTVSLS